MYSFSSTSKYITAEISALNFDKNSLRFQVILFNPNISCTFDANNIDYENPDYQYKRVGWN